MTTSIFIANKGPKTVYVLGCQSGKEPALLDTLEAGQTTQPDHCHVFGSQMIAITESKPPFINAASPSDDVGDDDDIEPQTTNASEPVPGMKAGDKI